MMRALWTGASGMITQQLSLDTLSNNLANVNTTAYKKDSINFQSLMYQRLQHEVTSVDGEVKPVIGQVGLGVRASSVVSSYVQGPILESDNDLDLAIEGNGFFMVGTSDGGVAYTRSGAFGLSRGSAGLTYCNPDGLPVLDTNGQPIIFNNAIDVSTIKINEFGDISYMDQNNQPQTVTIGLVQFNNPAGLEKMSNSLLAATENSGEPRPEALNPILKTSKVHAGRLEGANVQVADEIVNLIVTQRAYEMNSKSITAADEMLQQANNLRR